MIPAYCTNVHAGATLDASLEALRVHSTAVRRRLVERGDLDEGAPLGIGWWMSARAAAELVERPHGDGPPQLRTAMRERLREFFARHELRVTTYNGFPSDDFHHAVVKHRVYVPDWSTPERLAYTRDLAAIAAGLAESDVTERGSSIGISTLPLGWPTSPHLAQIVRQSAETLAQLALDLAALRERSGVRVHIDLEPEPGCLLQRSADVAVFAARHLRPAALERGLTADVLAEHIGICHDVCHAAVMGESQAAALATYAASGLRVGKVQLSSAISVDFDRLEPAARAQARDALGSFAEDRYLHQTMLTQRGRADDVSARSAGPGGENVTPDELRFYEDLPDALAALAVLPEPTGSCRIHFHVPIHMVDLGVTAPGVATTQHEIQACLDCLADASGGFAGSSSGTDAPVLEVETYAWNVLPASLRPATLAEGIADELHWIHRMLRERAGKRGTSGASR